MNKHRGERCRTIKIAPCECNTDLKVCLLRKAWTKVNGVTLDVDEFGVSITGTYGEFIELSCSAFNKLVQWWQTKQHARKPL